MGENVKSGCFEWLTDSSAIVPEICSHFIESIVGIEGIERCREKNVESLERDLEENVSSPSNLEAVKDNLEDLNDDRSLLVIDLGCGSESYLQNLSCSIKADFGYFISFHPPVLILPILSSIYKQVSSKTLPRSAVASATEIKPVDPSSSTAWDSSGLFRPSSVYQRSVFLYSCSRPLPPYPTRVEEAVRTAMDGYFREVEPMLTTEAERRLREGWGGGGRGIEEAYRLLFPDDSLRGCYSFEDFKSEWSAWGGEQGGTVEVEEGIRFLRENQ
ncbi:hypothetical protein TrCOL_g4371 [Triparma columacea]|uniref:Uncharacterized protein n=1 Tax=Triparma columacea TaxID=722753 RepID=A0A9W7GI75_9STRA|nr:hypothetical protein TrCOL_g4371 [Triparma columacea]